MTISKQIPLYTKANTYSWRGINPSGGTAVATVPVCTNGFFQVSENALDNSRKLAYCKRSGVLDLVYAMGATNLKTSNTGERIRGLCTSLDKTIVLFMSQDGTKRYSNIWNSSGNTLTQTDISANFSAGNYAMTVLDGINYGANVYYAANNGTDSAVINSSGVWTKITDVDLTGLGTKTNFVGLDGYLFVGIISGTGAGRIYNSDLGNATSWTATSYLSANDQPGSLVWLARIRNMIVAFKQFSIEFFEDTGNPTPGSPLTPRRQLIKRVGCASASTVQEVKDGIIFLGSDQNGKLRYYKLMRDSLELKDISDAYLEAALNLPTVSVGGYRSWSPDYALDSILKGQSQVINIQNKEFYTTVISSAWDGNPMTYVYDNELDIWVRWSTAFGNDGAMDGTFIPSMSFLLNNNNGGYTTCFVNNYSGNTSSRFNVMLVISDALNATLAGYSYQDQYELATANIHNFLFGWQSDFLDFGTGDRKFLHLVEIFYDSNPNQSVSSANAQTITFFHYEKDYNNNTSASAGRSISIDDAGYARAVVRQLGSFRRKAFKLLNTSKYPLRIWAIELVYSGGPDYA